MPRSWMGRAFPFHVLMISFHWSKTIQIGLKTWTLLWQQLQGVAHPTPPLHPQADRAQSYCEGNSFTLHGRWRRKRGSHHLSIPVYSNGQVWIFLAAEVAIKYLQHTVAGWWYSKRDMCLCYALLSVKTSNPMTGPYDCRSPFLQPLHITCGSSQYVTCSWLEDGKHQGLVPSLQILYSRHSQGGDLWMLPDINPHQPQPAWEL